MPALPGAPMLFGGLVLAAWAENFAYVGDWTIAALAVLALLTYAVDVIAGALGSFLKSDENDGSGAEGLLGLAKKLF